MRFWSNIIKLFKQFPVKQLPGMPKLCLDFGSAQVTGFKKGRENTCNHVSKGHLFNITRLQTQGVDMKLAAGSESQKKAVHLRQSAVKWRAAQELHKMAEVHRAETGHVLGGGGGGLSERGQCEEALNPEWTTCSSPFPPFSLHRTDDSLLERRGRREGKICKLSSSTAASLL